MKKILRGAFIALIVIFAVLIGASCYFISFALGNGGRNYNEEREWHKLDSLYPAIQPWTDSIRSTGALKRTWLLNADGDSIRVYYLPAQRPTAKTVVLAHGYKDCAIRMMHIGYMYHHDLGYNVLTYDQYAHGESEGSMIQMGWKDRKNLIMCARKADQLFGDTIVFHGISMGAATVMMSSGDEQLPRYVRAIVEDCGYTSVWDEFSGELKNQFSLPSFPLLNVVNAACKVYNGWSFREASALESVAKSKVPMLFIHSDNDDFVPTHMVYPLYNAHPGPKAIWMSKGSVHARSYRDHPKEYTQQVKEFLGKNLN